MIPALKKKKKIVIQLLKNQMPEKKIAINETNKK